MITLNTDLKCERVDAITHKGVNRSENQDSYLALPIEIGKVSGQLLAIADGMGGQACGKEASRLVIDRIREVATEEWQSILVRDDQILSYLEQLVFDCDQLVEEYVGSHVEARGMGTTLTIAIALEGRLYFAHVGDTRCWLFRDNELQQLTTDQTLAALYEKLVAPEHDSYETKRRLGHVLFCAIGCRMNRKDINLGTTLLSSGDKVLLTSDGIHDRLDTHSIAEILRTNEPNRVCDSLIESALQNGSNDDMTAIHWQYGGCCRCKAFEIVS